MDVDSSPADPHQTKEFCWRYLGGPQIVAPARYDGSACVIMVTQEVVIALVHRTDKLDLYSSIKDIDDWLLSKGYTPIW